ncbi:MAG: response regulator [Lachnospiraceae bacterium]|nr:response regulator [Lachnospiraceae bacterium]
MERILLIDDSMIQLRTLSMLLQDKYETVMATSGLEGIKLAKKKQPDLILLDYDMPGMSGRETFRQLQESEDTKDIPVVFLTGVDDRRDVEEVLKLRPQGYLLKPVEQERLLQTILDALY